MKDKSFQVKIYHSSFTTHWVKARTEDEAIKKARQLPIEENEIFNNLEDWHEADEAEEIREYAKSNGQSSI